jgi:hypothetical protein
MLLFMNCFSQPLSEKSKEHILSLDIEKDARLLHERLNICREALDYFCASSSILKAGVKAGLTLYDIAVMCCRNDNMGEIPSKLEVLFSMAAELAESAIENGRWHHAAASRALADQLSPVGGSLFSSSPGRKIQKSMSALTLPQFSEGLAGLAAATKSDTPGMIQSSASDSSSDAGEADHEDCEEWAASLIMDVSLEQSISLLNTKQRSPSIESENSSDSSRSGSPKGFWHVPPGSPPDDYEVSDDDDSISWEDSPSPSKDLFDMSETAFADQSRMTYNPFEGARRVSIVLSELPGEGGESMFQQFRSPAKVTFAEPAKTREEPPLDSRFKHSNSDVGESISAFLERPQGKMKRSQSYSALSSTMAENFVAEEENSKMCRPIDHAQYRDYFLKFIDLVIVRETTAASRQAKQDS